jgi:hypothetical protein
VSPLPTRRPPPRGGHRRVCLPRPSRPLQWGADRRVAPHPPAHAGLRHGETVEGVVPPTHAGRRHRETVEGVVPPTQAGRRHGDATVEGVSLPPTPGAATGRRSKRLHPFKSVALIKRASLVSMSHTLVSMAWTVVRGCFQALRR